jgi:hypothetical protein
MLSFSSIFHTESVESVLLLIASLITSVYLHPISLYTYISHTLKMSCYLHSCSISSYHKCGRG